MEWKAIFNGLWVLGVFHCHVQQRWLRQRVSFLGLLYKTYHKLVVLKQRKCILLQFQRPEIQNQDVVRVWFLVEALRENALRACPHFWCRLVRLGVLWLQHANQSLPPSFQGWLLCVSFPFLSCVRTPIMGFKAPPTPISFWDPYLNCICKDPYTEKKRYILRFRVEWTFGKWSLFHPPQTNSTREEAINRQDWLWILSLLLTTHLLGNSGYIAPHLTFNGTLRERELCKVLPETEQFYDWTVQE